MSAQISCLRSCGGALSFFFSPAQGQWTLGTHQSAQISGLDQIDVQRPAVELPLAVLNPQISVIRLDISGEFGRLVKAFVRVSREKQETKK